jgi:hypothetical protein
MPRAPNYSHERKQRDLAKANKKAEKLAAKTAAKNLEKAEADGKQELKPEE